MWCLAKELVNALTEAKDILIEEGEKSPTEKQINEAAKDQMDEYTEEK